MQVSLRACGKMYLSKWVFKNLDVTFEAGNIHAVTGKNGSGKSTLLKIIAGYIRPSAGNVEWKLNDAPVHPDAVFTHLSLTAPYLELIEEFSLLEMIRFQRYFKKFQKPWTDDEVAELAGLAESAAKPLKHFSSGMKQRVRIALSILSASPLLLLDEPCSNLDEEGRLWYASLLKDYGASRTIIIASNHNKEEYPGCEHVIGL